MRASSRGTPAASSVAAASGGTVRVTTCGMSAGSRNVGVERLPCTPELEEVRAAELEAHAGAGVQRHDGQSLDRTLAQRGVQRREPRLLDRQELPAPRFMVAIARGPGL